MTTIDKIRAEIERRINELAKDKRINLHDTLHRTEELNIVLQFLDTLQEPEVDLEKEIKDYCHKYYNYDYPKQYIEKTGANMMPHIIESARHFYELGKNAK